MIDPRQPSRDESWGAYLMEGRQLPPLRLLATDGCSIDFARWRRPTLLVLHTFVLPDGLASDDCFAPNFTMQACKDILIGFKRSHGVLAIRGWSVFGISTQSPLTQKVIVRDLALPFPLLSDPRASLARALDLPTLRYGGRPRMPRLVLEMNETKPIKVHVPRVDPLDEASHIAARLPQA